MIECPTEDSLPIPISNGKPFANLRKKAEAACLAAHLMIGQGYKEDPYEGDIDEDIKNLVVASAGNGEKRRDIEQKVLSSTEGAMRVHSILTEFDKLVVRDAAQMRTYVTNKLVLESDNADPRVRIKALELLGKITDVGLFTERSEVTINNKSTIELENTLKDKLRKLMGATDAEDAILVNKPIPVPTRTVNIAADLGGS